MIAAKPHSADTERLVRMYNKLHNCGRSFLASKALRIHLHLSQNMGKVESVGSSQSALDCLMVIKRGASFPGNQKSNSGLLEAEEFRKERRFESSIGIIHVNC